MKLVGELWLDLQLTARHHVLYFLSEKSNKSQQCKSGGTEEIKQHGKLVNITCSVGVGFISG